ncbi:MAG: hypothetical protein JWN86_453 [Planctomycetota bacterium]|nr:hypothetical protein [Planctomycetota bacterium]
MRRNLDSAAKCLGLGLVIVVAGVDLVAGIHLARTASEPTRPTLASPSEVSDQNARGMGTTAFGDSQRDASDVSSHEWVCRMPILDPIPGEFAPPTTVTTPRVAGTTTDH